MRIGPRETFLKAQPAAIPGCAEPGDLLHWMIRIDAVAYITKGKHASVKLDFT
jgi:hypothetical protein